MYVHVKVIWMYIRTYIAYFVYVAGEHAYTALEHPVHQHPSKNTQAENYLIIPARRFMKVASATIDKQGGDDIIHNNDTTCQL